MVAHSISVMVLQARGGRRVLETEPADARDAFAIIEQTGHQALEEMRRLLGMLRRSDGELALAPQPSLNQLGRLVEQVQAAGLPVQVAMEGEPRELPPGVDLSAFRIVQEALTNALTHAGPARARLLVRYRADDLELEITDDGAGNSDSSGSGYGLIGMRERVSVYGGELHAGRRPRRRLRATRPPAARLGPTMTIRVLLADDQKLVRGGFRMILRAEPDIEVVGEAADGAEAVALARQVDPDVVLMDVRMPNVDGIEATRQIVDRSEDAPRVLVLTTFDLDQYVYEALRAGASGFLLKDAPDEQLVSGIRIVASGGSLFAPAVTRRLIERFAGTPPPRPPPALGDLTPRELEVLRLLARGLSNAEIAAQLVISEHTAKTHVAHILNKLDLRDRVHAVVLAYESGIVHVHK